MFHARKGGPVLSEKNDSKRDRTAAMTLVDRGPMTVVGLPIRAVWDDLWTEVPKAWETLFARLAEIQHRLDDRLIDVSLTKTGNEYLQLVGAHVSQVRRIPEGMCAVSIPPHRFIYNRHVGPVQDIAESFGTMYAWAREHAHSAGAFKVDIGYTVDGDELEHDLYIALAPDPTWQFLM